MLGDIVAKSSIPLSIEYCTALSICCSGIKPIANAPVFSKVLSLEKETKFILFLLAIGAIVFAALPNTGPKISWTFLSIASLVASTAPNGVPLVSIGIIDIVGSFILNNANCAASNKFRPISSNLPLSGTNKAILISALLNWRFEKLESEVLIFCGKSLSICLGFISLLLFL